MLDLHASLWLALALFSGKAAPADAGNSSAPLQEPPLVLLDPRDFAASFGPDLAWAARNVPLFTCSDADLSAAYAFRWRVYRAHIQPAGPWGRVITEFLPPVSWAGPYNTIAGSAGHHIYEGRWLRDGSVLDEYSRFWFGGAAQPRAYTAWLTDAIHARALVSGDWRLPLQLLGPMRANLAAWKAGHWLPRPGCFWQDDTWDGGEDSISGGGCRVSINSVMYGEWRALAAIERRAGNVAAAAALEAEAEALRARTLELLWDPQLQFLTGLKPDAGPPPGLRSGGSGRPPNSRCPGAPEWPAGRRVPVRELLALSTPNYFKLLPLPGDGRQANFSRMWQQVSDPRGFAAPWGPRTAERRHPAYNFSCDHPCTWNGPSWPFETARLLTGLANFLAVTSDSSGSGSGSGSSSSSSSDSSSSSGSVGGGSGSGGGGGGGESSSDISSSSSDSGSLPAARPAAAADASLWLALMRQYAALHTRAAVAQPSDVAGRRVPEHPWVGESAHPDEGYWLSREYMLRHGEWDWRRGYLYNHATFADLVITGLVGLRPRSDGRLQLRPLGCALAHFALDGLAYHGHTLAVAWDASGTVHRQGQGLRVWVGGRLALSRRECGPVELALPGEGPEGSVAAAA